MIDQGSASLKAATKLTTTVTIVPGLATLWYAYLAAAGVHAQLQSNWGYIRQAALSDGTAGQLYAQLYVAEQAKDAAWTAWDNLRKIQHPAPPTN